MPALVTNNAKGRLSGSLTNVATLLSLNTGQGSLFPTPTAPDFFYVTIISAANAREIVKVTTRASDTFTIVRAQDGTSALAFDADSRVELCPIAALHNNYPQLDKENTFVGDQTITGTLAVSGATSAGLVSNLTGAAATDRRRVWQTGDESRWAANASNDAEGGSNAGTDFEIERYGDNGVLIDVPLRIVRATGIATVKAGFVVGTSKADAFPTGTALPFYNDAPPTGWTANAALDEHTIKLVAANGGTAGGVEDFADIFTERVFIGTTEGHAITEAQMPPHRHFIANSTEPGFNGQPALSNANQLNRSGSESDLNQGYNLRGGSTDATVGRSSSVGSGSAHTHELSLDADLDVKYAKMVVGVKAA